MYCKNNKKRAFKQELSLKQDTLVENNQIFDELLRLKWTSSAALD